MVRLTFYGGVNEIGGNRIPLEIASQINPEVLIPVHSEYPSFYIEHLGGSGINVILSTVGGTMEV